jgi:exonuclease SbcC
MRTRTKLLIIGILALLLLFAAGCQQPKPKHLKAKTTAKAVNDSADAEADVREMINASLPLIEEEPVEEVDTSGMSATCVLVIRQMELEIEQARNASRDLDHALAAKTDAYVQAQLDYENAAKASNPSRTATANATLKRARSEWEDAKDEANDGREEVRLLKLALVKAKDDCDPAYVPPAVNNTPPPPRTPSQCDNTKLDDLREDYDGVLADIDAKRDELQELRDELDELEEDLEDAEDANDTAEAQSIQEDIDDKEEEIDDKDQEIDDLEEELEDKRDAYNDERERCGLSVIGGASTNSTDICDEYEEDEVQEDIDELRDEIQELEDEIDDLETQKDAAEAAGDSGEVERLEDEIQEREDEIDEKEEEIDDLEEILQDLEDC